MRVLPTFKSKRRKTVLVVDSSSDEDDDVSSGGHNLGGLSVVSPEQEVRFRKLFDDIDTDGSQSLDVEELITAMAKMDSSFSNNESPNEVNANPLDGFADLVMDMQAKTASATGGSAVELDFATFCVILGLSERKHGLESLNRDGDTGSGPAVMYKKIVAAEELFNLMVHDPAHPGEVKIEELETQLSSAGTPKHEIKAFENEISLHGQREFVAFTDYVKYLPLFAKIHQQMQERPV